LPAQICGALPRWQRQGEESSARCRGRASYRAPGTPLPFRRRRSAPKRDTAQSDIPPRESRVNAENTRGFMDFGSNKADECRQSVVAVGNLDELRPRSQFSAPAPSPPDPRNPLELDRLVQPPHEDRDGDRGRLAVDIDARHLLEK